MKIEPVSESKSRVTFDHLIMHHPSQVGDTLPVCVEIDPAEGAHLSAACKAGVASIACFEALFA